MLDKVSITIDADGLTRALEGFSTAMQSACAAAASIGYASPWAMQIADEARMIGELMAKAMLITGKTDTEIRALAAQSLLCFTDFVAQLTTPPPIAQPFVPAPPAVPAAPQRFVRQGYYDVCVTCKLAREWCGCARQEVETAAPDGAHSDLSKRIADLRQKAGGR